MAVATEGYRPIEIGKAREQRLQAAEAIDLMITPTRIVDTLRVLHDSTAPSGTVLYTRTPDIRDFLESTKIPLTEFDPRFLRTRSPAILLNRPQALWFSAHSDQIGYVPPFTNSDSFDINAISAHRPEKPKEGEIYPEFPGSVLRFVPGNERGTGKYEVISTGVIGTTSEGTPYFHTKGERPRGGFHPGYDRIAYTPAFEYDKKTGLIRANNDNAAGVAATIVALQALERIAAMRGKSINEMGFGVVFPDEEEGLPEASAYFSREARRIGNLTPESKRPKYIVEIDGHDTLRDEDPGSFAVYGSVVSKGKGAIVPPDVYAIFDGLFKHVATDQDQLNLELAPLDIRPTEDGNGSLSRSNDAAFMEFSGQIMPVGYLGRDPHHNKGISTTNVNGLVNTARAIAWIGAYANKLWVNF